MIIQPIVEGHGEIVAFPRLLHRISAQLGATDIRFENPVRGNRTSLVQQDGLRKRVQIARLRPNLGGILILIDADDDCPKTLAPQITAWARNEATPIPCEVVIAMREFEAWFLGGIEGLRGKRGFRTDARAPDDPEAPRNAKGLLETYMVKGVSYSPTTDQHHLAGLFDLDKAAARCRSFRRLKKAVASLIHDS